MTIDVWAPKGQGSISTKLALMWGGDLQYQIIQPIAGDVDFKLDTSGGEDSEHLYDICVRVENWKEFR